MRKLERLMQDDSGYIAERKIDGCHYTAIEGQIFSTHITEGSTIPVEKTAQLPHLARALKPFGQAIFDGEVNYPGLRSNDVTTITGCHADKAIARQEQQGWLKYTIFDLLRLPDGTWLLDQPWFIRRKYLDELEEFFLTPHIEINKTVQRNKQAFLDEILMAGGEGIVLKDVSNIYVAGKRPMWNWIKLKTEIEDDIVIIGFEPPKRVYTGENLAAWPYWIDGTPITKFHHFGWYGAIIMGKYNGSGDLVRVGTCSGMTEAQRIAFTERPDEFIGKVAKIKAMEITRDGAYRHPSFECLHPDKNPWECVLD